MRYKYKFKDLNCEFCLKQNKIACTRGLYPHIMANLSDLFADANFREAVRNAEKYRSPHRNTLKYLKKKAEERGISLSESGIDITEDEKCAFKPEYGKCSYNSTGFICFNKNDGSCLKDWIKDTTNAQS